MTTRHSLSDDSESALIIEKSAKDNLEGELKKKTNEKRNFFKRLRSEFLDGDVPENCVEKIYKGVDSLVQFRAGNEMRGYCVYTDSVPSYNILYIFEITDHKYSKYELSKYDARAGKTLEELDNLSNTEEVEQYLANNNAHYSEDIKEYIQSI